VVVNNRYFLNGGEYEKVREMNDGKMMMRNLRNGQTITVDPRTLTTQPENINNINSAEEIYIRSGQKPLEQTEVVDAALANEINSNTIYFDKNRKIKTANKEFIMMGNENDGTVRAYNTSTKRI